MIPMIPAIINNTIGFVLNFLRQKNEHKNSNTAIQSISVTMLIFSVPVNVNSKIVVDAETINPSEAAFNPFKTSKTYIDFLYF